MDPTELLRELIRLDTTNPPGNEEPAADLLRSVLDDAGLKTHIHTSDTGRPSLIARLEGPSDRPALVLVSHTDVVAAEADGWSRDPFGGELVDGCVWGRGALDMKGIAVMHVAAVAALAGSDEAGRREVIVASFADEEAGGAHGARSVLGEVPDALGFGDGRPAPDALGEGAFGLSGILDRPLMPVVVGEKSALWLELEARGDPGHGALPPLNQAPLNLARALNKISGRGDTRVHPVMREQFRILGERVGGGRAAAFKALASGAGNNVARALKKPLSKSGAIAALLSDTLTPTRIEAGYKHNVVPGEARASLDCRLLPDTDIDAMKRKLEKVCARYDVTVSEMARHGGPVSARTDLFDAIVSVSERMAERPIPVPSLTSGMTDLRFLRSRGAAAYGWVPLVVDPDLLGTIHGHDERVEVAAFERAVDAMSQVVRRVGAPGQR
ncbi:MAG TPA: M20/M25/M40 family metallo-hydrolase [Actinomycetota bacterium]|nr:M20/M25/M40 family metallo-hydrolase [Actinomycetota bacterium]